MNRNVASLLLVAGVSLAPLAHADLFTFTGDTTGKPVYNRPFEDLSGLSGIGIDVNYDTFTFKVSVTGDYTVLTTGVFDTFVTLYAGSFNPAAPLTNAVVANDDIFPGTFTTSGFPSLLTAGTTYLLVTTGFDSGEFGKYSTTIGGPGVVSVVPEPLSYALFALGLGAVALRRRSALAAND